MAFIAQPLFAGDLHDAACRLATQTRTTGTVAAAAVASRPDAADVRDAASQAAPGNHAEPSALWRSVLELGWQGVLIAEAAGGAGASLPDLVALVEGTSRGASAIPLADRCGVAPVLLGAAQAKMPDPQLAELLALIASGQASVCPVLDGGRGSPGVSSAVVIDADGRLRGSLKGLDLSEPATHLLFRARRAGDGQSAVVLLPFDTVSTALRCHTGLDDRLVADVDLGSLPQARGRILLQGEAADRAVSAARLVGAVLGCAQAVGALAALIELTIDYLNTRAQFDVKLSSFQVLRHRVVDMYVAYENLSGLVRRVASELGSTSSDASLEGFTSEVAMLKLYAATVSRQVAESAIQLHGGMGMTLELQAPRLAMSVLATSLDHGERGECLDWLVERAQAEACIG